MNYTDRIDPDTAQQELMLRWLETCRQLYNRCLRDLKDWMNSRKCQIDRCSINREYQSTLGQRGMETACQVGLPGEKS